MPVDDAPNYDNVPQGLAEGHYLARCELDRMSPSNSVYVRGIWKPWNAPLSVSICNLAAVRLAGVDSQTLSPGEPVAIDHAAQGEPTDIMTDYKRYPSVKFTLMKVVSRFTHVQQVESPKDSMRILISSGWVTPAPLSGTASLLRSFKV